MLEENYLNKLDEDIKKEFKKASNLLDVGEFNKAENEFKEILNEVEDFIPALNKLAVIEIYNDNLEQANELIDKILKKDPEYVAAITNLGSIYKKKGQIEKAKKLYEKAIDIEPDYGNAYNNLGVIYREQGEYKKSVKYLKKARKRGSYSFKIDDKPLYKNKGCVFFVVVIILIILLLIYILWGGYKIVWYKSGR